MASILDQDPGTLGKRVKLARKTLGYTQEQLASLVDITQKAVAKIEGDKQKGLPKRETLMGLSRALQVPLSWIIHGSARFEANDKVYEAAKLLSELPEDMQDNILNQLRFLTSHAKPTEPGD